PSPRSYLKARRRPARDDRPSPGAVATTGKSVGAVGSCAKDLYGFDLPEWQLEPYQQPRHSSESGDQGDRALERGNVRGDAGNETAEYVAHVAPESVDADRGCPCDRRDLVRDRS